MNISLAIVIIVCAAVLGPAAVISVVGFATIKALGRNPSAAAKIYVGVVLMLVFAECTSIISLLVVYHLFAGLL